MTRSQSTPPRTSERTFGGSSPISYFSRPRSRHSDQSMLRNIRYDWGNTSNAFERQSNTRERRLYFQSNNSRQGAFDISYNRLVSPALVQPWFSPSPVLVTVRRTPDMILSTNPLRNQMSGSFTGSPPDLAVIGKHHLPIRNDTVRDMMLRFSDYLAVRRY